MRIATKDLAFFGFMNSRTFFFGVLAGFIGVFFLACDDGDLQVESITDFDAVALQTCVTDTTAVVFFKIVDSEALVLQLQSGLLTNEITTDSITSVLGGQSMLNYRFFDATVTTAYFCSEIPPVTPVVQQEIPATAGTVSIITTAVDVGGTASFSHNIKIYDLNLVNTNGERLTDTTILEFGDFVSSPN